MLRLFIIFSFIPYFVFTQNTKEWIHLDPEQDSILGISTYRAFEFLEGKESQEVVVAVIDNGLDIDHEDIHANVWVNKAEIPDNNIDDDKNGYIDDIHGWNFLGNEKGENMKFETLVVTRYYKILKEKFEGKSKKDIPKSQKKEFQFYQQVKAKYNRELKLEEIVRSTNEILLERYLDAKSTIDEYFQNEAYTIKELVSLESDDKDILWAQKVMVWANDNAYNEKSIKKSIEDVNKKINSRLNLDYNKREEIVGDDPSNISDSFYGNNQVDARGPYHGTSVAGVIAAMHNEVGISGIARNVKIMVLRVVPNGDERDKDVALAIKYAVRNGADIINCSFAKDYMMHPEFIYDAMKEAEEAGVLIVHSAGNESRNKDKYPAHPNGFYSKKHKASNWMNIGATKSKDTEKLIAYFSNYGKKSVDVFAPGSGILTLALSDRYERSSGTSIAAPVISGIAAVLKSYYPHLTAQQIREIIIESSYKPKSKRVFVPGEGKLQKPFKKLSISGGIANLYYAVKLAEEY